jgi:omega-3 fatty acid desaturase (delta-15 desaturase)
LAALYAAALALDSWLLFPFFAFAQGTLFWSLFVIGHDCGHGSFSRRRWLNDLVGHLLHTPLLVPYQGWRSSHRLHHRFTGNADREEAWRPLTEAQYRALPWYTRLLRDRLTLFVFPFYLLRGTPWRAGSHFHPRSPLFRPSDRGRVLTSGALCAGWLAGLVALASAFGPLSVLRHYVAPWLVFVVWVDLVTLLHHAHPEVPWCTDESWSPLRGALATVDRRYGWLERVHHHAGHHVAHHLFPEIPHYRLAEATASLRSVLGAHYRESREPPWRALGPALRQSRRVDERRPASRGLERS